MAAAASDKARFYMEQSVPELQEFSRKGIFSAGEITAIAQKRSEFEHLINMPGAATPADYARYATYEMNLDSLRKARSKRLGVKGTTYTGQKKIFFVLERGVRKFQGDMGLWMQYLEYCRQEKANKKLAKALTQCLRLHPLKWELWVWAARQYVEQQADMTTGRSYMQRGLRFCKNERALWLQYAKLEMIYVVKIAARRKILGLDVIRTTKEMDSSYDPDADMIALPSITAEDINPELHTYAEVNGDTEAVNKKALHKLSDTPALSGAIPMTIMDTALAHFKDDPLLAESFFDLFAEFPDAKCTQTLLKHTVEHLERLSSKSTKATLILVGCKARKEILGIDVTSPEFPLALGKTLQHFSQVRRANPDLEASIAVKAILLLFPFLAQQDVLDEGVVKVLDASMKQYIRLLSNSKPTIRGKSQLEEVTQKLEADKRVDLKLLARFGLAEDKSDEIFIAYDPIKG